jgi:5-methylcytosine-specific restriction protein A
MPLASKKPCRYPGCGVAVHRGVPYCKTHTKAVRKQSDQLRGTAASRGYDKAWQQLRKLYLAEHPLCECDDCQAGTLLLTAAQVVDHRIPISERPDLRLSWMNLRAMSKTCHDRHTARTQGFAQQQQRQG